MTEKLQLRITGMDCADCALKLEKGVANLAGVEACQVNFTTAKMEVITAGADEAQVVKRIQNLGYNIAPPDEVYQPRTRRQQLVALLRQPRNTFTLIGAAFITAAFILEGLLPAGENFLFSSPAPLLLLAPALFFIGGLFGLYFPARAGWAAIRSGQGLDMNVLMCLAAVGAFAIGEYGEAATVIVLFSLGEALEGYTMERARDSIRSLTQLAPAEAIVLQPCIDCQGCRGRELPDGSGPYQSGPCPWCGLHEERVPVARLAVGDRILVKPSERIPMDGQVVSGQSAVNQAPITGESVPVEKSQGAEVFAGTINGDGVLEIEVTRLAADNTLSRLIHLVEEAQSQKTPTQRFVDKFARVYTPLVVVGAGLMAVLPPLLFGQPFFDPPFSPLVNGGGWGGVEHGWLYRALTMLVIACPCALVIATPVAVVSAIAAAARRGVLIKGGAYLEALGQVKVIAFDKTGTLTQGRPELVNLACIDRCCVEARQHDLMAECAHCDDMLALAAAVERYSTHPLARAVTAAAETRALPALAATGVKTLPGQGVQGQVGGRLVTIGSHTLLHDDDACLREFCGLVGNAEAHGQTTILVRENETLRGYLAVSDPPRHTSQTTVGVLRKTGVTHTVMLTGDNPTVAEAIGRQLDVDEVRAGLMPADKVSAIRELMAVHGDMVAMVGDGVNDAPALAAATVGIAMGAGGTAQALETADVALMADDLTQLPAAIRLGRRAVRTIRFNIWFALIIKAVFLLAAFFGVATLWMAVFADMGASLLVTLNGMRLLRQNDR
ncbi:MAG: heavy metal translocating P-type ATPase [Anaerolineae bacterium]|nr:cation-translocating P-type ATPase [Anaerolineales bacterium]MCQ3973206.1 heavy metal translocating P-type ATPase [Anaerolineae bacterium]